MEWTLFVYDFDYPHLWTPRFNELLKPNAVQIVHEVERQLQWELAGSDVRMREAKPPAPLKDYAIHKIQKDLSRNYFRAFHATRLIRPEVVLEEGLRALDARRQIDLIERTYQDVRRDARLNCRMEALGARRRDSRIREARDREGICWLVPSRHLLHDGGLDCMFERIGGEFIERISDDPFRDMSDKGLDPGRATVVVATLPSGWCWLTNEAGSMRIFCKTMASLGHPLHNRLASYWDVKIKADIPPGNIEYVCDRSDERVAVPADCDGGAGDMNLRT